MLLAVLGYVIPRQYVNQWFYLVFHSIHWPPCWCLAVCFTIASQWSLELRVRCWMVLSLTFKSMYYAFLLLPMLAKVEWHTFYWEYMVLKASPEGRSERKRKGKKHIVTTYPSLFDGILPLSLTWKLINVCCLSEYSTMHC